MLKNVNQEIQKSLYEISFNSYIKKIKKNFEKKNCFKNFKKIFHYYLKTVNIFIVNQILYNYLNIPLIINILFTNDIGNYFYFNSIKIIDKQIIQSYPIKNIQNEQIYKIYKNYKNNKNTTYPLIETISINKIISMENLYALKLIKKYFEPTYDCCNNKIAYSIYTGSQTTYSTSSSTNTPTTYTGINGFWYQTYQTKNQTSEWCLNSGIQINSNGTPIQINSNGNGTSSVPITWSSIPGNNNYYPIPTYYSGNIPFNCFVMTYNDTTNPSYYTNVDASNSYNGTQIPANCWSDVTNYYYNSYKKNTTVNYFLVGMQLGSGNTGGGAWSQSSIANIIDSVNSGKLSPSNIVYTDSKGNGWAYNSIIVDIEVQSSSDTSNLIIPFTGGSNSWTYNDTSYDGLLYSLNNAGFAVFVTISHSAPYGFTTQSVVPNDSSYCLNIVTALYSCVYVNQFIPQLYTQAVGTSNEYAITNGITFEQVVQAYILNPNYLSLVNAGLSGGELLSVSLYMTFGFTYQGVYYNSNYYGAGTNASSGTTNNYQPNMSYNDSSTNCNCGNGDITSPGYGYPYPYPPPTNEFPTGIDTGAYDFLTNTWSSQGAIMPTLAGNFMYNPNNLVSQLY